MTGPTVSVIIAAYNAMPYLTRCVSSAAEQSIGRDALEIIVVNDGSTDGTAAELKRLADEYPGLLRLFDQPNSGGPSVPRNVGLDHARGRFVFFLDADDHLGPEALERMVAMAEENDTDIVVGKMVGVGGRKAPTSMFRHNQPKTDVFSSRVYWTLNPMKLFRRDLLERHELRFPTDLSIGEDQLFVGAAYLHAAGVSVLADYDCLFWMLREDESNITVQSGGSEPRLRYLPRVVDMILENVPPGPGRDHLAHRHLTVPVQKFLHNQLVREDPATQQKTLRRLAEIIEPLWHDGMNERLSALARLRLHLVRHRRLDELLEFITFEETLADSSVATPVLVEDGRALARYPFLRDPALAVPDICYDVTAQLGTRHQVTRAELYGTTLHLAGHAYIHRVETDDVTTELVLRERDRGTEYRLPVDHTATPGLGAEEDEGHYTYEHAGFEASVDITTAADGEPLDDGLWDISLAIGAQGLSREVRIGSKRATTVSGKPTTHVVDVTGDLRAITLYTTKPHGNLTLDLGENKHTVPAHLSLTGARWAKDAPSELEFTGRCTLSAFPDSTLTIALDHGQGGTGPTFPVSHLSADGTFSIRIPVTSLPAGVWQGELRLGRWALPLPARPRQAAPAKWRRHGLPWYAKPTTTGNDHFALHVARTDVVRALIRRFKR
ncbi:glycosyltransferase family 2 protein [Streptomyces cadmiisoli]|uniref:Glycosyltransferase family 2 protein n=2 Tax=Streptomyces cadmiisoli TaxID=2184053 RepID=A0A2Z4JAG8_9ACTN|nr:glycosyltransferase family 2 protein [Streptomyces cadmiisoli]